MSALDDPVPSRLVDEMLTSAKAGVAALDETQAIALRTARLVDGFEERLAKLTRRVETLERANDRLRRAVSPNDGSEGAP